MRNIEAEADARRAIVREARDRRVAERTEWTDDTTPRTDAPVRFVYVHRAGWYAGRGAILGMVGTLWTHLRHS